MPAETKLSKMQLVPFLRLLLAVLPLALASGSAAAIFLIALDAVGQLRDEHIWVIALLPLAGLAIGWAYHRYGGAANQGSELMFEAYRSPKKNIPIRVAPLVLFGTLLTHLGGGSAGREGTAMQMATAFADTFFRRFKFSQVDRQLLLLCGISGGFAAVFGTPWAGAVFALEVLAWRKRNVATVLLVVITAWLSHWVCVQWPVVHAHYEVSPLTDIKWSTPFWVSLLGLAAGLTAALFVRTSHFFKHQFQRISYPPLRPVVGGVLLALLFCLPGSLRYAGLGLPLLASAFTENLLPWDFLLKLLFTAFTLGAAFKGGEVTPLFLMGAALGNVLSLVIPLPMALLVALGFVAVFAGATNTPVACWVMGMELFGWEYGLWLGLACGIAYWVSGHRSIYSNQPLSPVRRYLRLSKWRKKKSL